MCGRYTIKSSRAVIVAQFDLGDLPDLTPRYNVAPTQNVPVVRLIEGRRECALLRWGLVPSWADDVKIGNRLLNARAETIASKPAFRAPFRKRRCLIPADGYFEWQKMGRTKQPYYFHRRDDGVFAFAGLWEHWERGGEVIESCTIITTDANDLGRPIHDRMPVILDPEAYAPWLDPELEDTAPLLELLRPYPAELLRSEAVNPIVNSPRHDAPACIQPLAG